MQRICFRTHDLVQEIKGIDQVLSQYLDADIEEILGGGEAATERNALRALQSALKGFADNYTGAGSLTDKSYEIAKRVKPVV
jgi:hypothetical protein